MFQVLQRWQRYEDHDDKEQKQESDRFLQTQDWMDRLEQVLAQSKSDKDDNSTWTSRTDIAKPTINTTTASVRPDPTLFLGWEDQLTRAEMEYLTALLVAGQVDQLVQRWPRMVRRVR